MTACLQQFLAAVVVCALTWSQARPVDLAMFRVEPEGGQGNTLVQSAAVNLALCDSACPAENTPQVTLHCLTVEGYGSHQSLAEWLSVQRELSELNLICISLSDSNVNAVTSLPWLERLDLRGCVVTEAQLDRLCSIATLRELDLRGVMISQELSRKRRIRFPGLHICTDNR